MAAAEDLHWMQHALNLAKQAAVLGEVPIGACVVAANNALLGDGLNCPISEHDPTAHAEIRALRAAAQQCGNYRLPETTLYVTLEPCLMCYGALVHARVARVVFACKDPKVGVFSCHHGGHDWGALNHTVVWEQGPMADEAAALLQHFFAARRRST